MKKILKQTLAIMLAVVMTVGAAPLAGFVGLELPDVDFSSLFATKAEAATSGTCGDNLTWSFDETAGTLTILGSGQMKGYSSSSSVPWYSNRSNIKSVNLSEELTSIGDYAFENCTGLTSITIPDSVTSIGRYAFKDCTGLKNITIPDSVTSIGNAAFRGCNSLESMTLPFVGNERGSSNKYNNVFGYIFGYTYSSGTTGTTLQCYAPYSQSNDYYCHYYIPSSLRSVVITDETKIPYGAFYGCTGLTSVTILDSVTSIGDEAFYGCTRLTSVTIPDSVTSIGDEAFNRCTGLTSVTIPDSVISIGEKAFYGCNGLTSITVDFDNENYSSDEYGVLFNKDKTMLIQYPIGDTRTSYVIPDSVTSIGDEAFNRCTGLTSVTIPDSVTSIGWYAFEDCTGLTSIIIPDSVTSIGWYAFNRCTGLTSITIPDSVTSIGGHAFYGCTGLTTAYYPGSPEEWKKINIDAYNDNLTQNIIFESDSERPYYSSGSCGENLIWKLYGDGELVISGTGNMTDYTYASAPWYSKCSKITSVSLPEGLTSIGDYSFYNCISLTDIIIPDSVTSIGEGVFSYCSSLTNITVDTDNKNYSFDEYGVLFNKDKTTLIQYLAGNTRTNYEIPDSVTSIGASAFSGCFVLTSVTIPDSVTSIGEGAFKGCNSLESITLPFVGDERGGSDSYTDVFGYIFGYTTSSFAVGTIVQQYDTAGRSYKYYIPSSLKTVVITDETVIPCGAFSGCAGLTSVTIGNDATRIGPGAFSGCAGLTSVTIPDSVTSIGYAAFKDCTGLTSVTIPDSVTSIGNGAFEGCDSLESITLPFVGASRDATTSAAVLGYVFGYKTESFSKKYFYSYDAPRPGFINSGYGSDGGAIWQYTYCEYDRYYNNYYYYDFYVYYYYIPSTLKKVTITDAKTIQTAAFNGCENLSEISINNEVASIGSYAFQNCTGLKTVYYDGTFKEWNNITIGSANTQLKNAEKYSIYFATFNAAGGTFSDGSNRQKFRMKISENYVSCEEPTKEGYVFVGWSPKVPNEIPKENVKFYAQWKKVNAVEHEHETKIYNAITPTCTADGHTGYIYCETCNEIIDYGEAIPAYGHDFDVQVTVEPTCTEKGEGIYTCKYCDYSETGEVAAKGHSYDNGVVTLEPTCTVKGTKTFTCSACSVSYTEDIAATGNHSYKGEITTEPGCVEKGVETFTCSMCGDVYTEEVDAKGHSYDIGVVTIQPTCTEKGIKTFTCSTCGDYYTEDIAATGHKYVGSITTQPTCTQTGVMTNTCSNCGDFYTEELVKKPHSYSITVESVPTKTENGIIKYTCSGCGDSYTKTTNSKLETASVKIDTYSEDIFVCYGDKLVLTATGTDLPENAKLVWYTDEVKKAEGNKLEIASVGDLSKVTVKAVDSNGNVITANHTAVEDSANIGVIYPSIKNNLNYGITNSQVHILLDNENLSGDIIVPSMVDGYPVTQIGKMAFYNNTKITSVRIPEGVTSIGPNAFCGCTNITEIYLPESLKKIDDYAFRETAISSIFLSRNITSIGSGVFNGCASLKKVIIPDGITKLNTYLFSDCTSLETVVIPKSVTRIEGSVFNNCPDLYSIYYLGTEAEWNSVSIGLSMSSDYDESLMEYNETRTIREGNGGAYCGFSDGFRISGYNESYEDSYQKAINISSVLLRPGYEFDDWTPSYTDNNKNTIVYAMWIPKHDHEVTVLNRTYPGCEEGHTGYVYCETCNDIIDYGSVIPSNGHRYNSGVVTTKATCTKNGIKTFTCSACGDVYTEDIAALGHSYTGVVTKEPTCAEKGIKTFTCSACGDTYTEDIEVLGHTYSSSITKVPTCTEEGEMTYTCSVCNDFYTKPINKRTHTYSGTTVTKEPTCTEDGEESYYCSVCKETYTNKISAIGHNYNSVVMAEPNCTQAGTRTFTCANCNDVYTEKIEALGHIEVVDKAVAPSCTQSGLTQGLHCERCNNALIKQEVVPATGHQNYGEWQIVQNSTCTSEGEKYRVCADCGHTEYSNIELADHTWNIEYTVDKAATCTADGSKSIHCSKCSATKDSTVIPATGHTEAITAGTSATCTASGKTDGKYCSVCKEVLVKQETIPATGHQNYSEWQITTESSCTVEGKKYRECTDCGHKDYQKVELADHVWNNEHTVDKDATCTTDGSKSIHCLVCSATKDTVVIPATGHTEAISKGIEPTCSATGKTEGKYCSVCNEVLVKQETIPAKAHTEVVDNAVAPTYEKTGLTEGKHCSVCGKVTVAQKTVAKLAAPTLKIRNNNGSTTLDYGNSIKLTAVTNNLPEGAKIFWYVDGAKTAEGETLTINEPKNSVTVNVKLVDASGNAIVINGSEIGDTEKINVNNGFFQKIIAFFKKLFGATKTISQAFML